MTDQRPLEQRLQEAIASGAAVADLAHERGGTLRYRRAPDDGVLMTLAFVEPDGSERLAVQYFAPAERPAAAWPAHAPFVPGRVMQFAPAPAGGGNCIWELDDAGEGSEVERLVVAATLGDGWLEVERDPAAALPDGVAMRGFERPPLRRMLMRTPHVVMITDAVAGAGLPPLG